MLDTNGKPIVIKVGGGDFEPVPADRYTCQIVDVSAEERPNSFKGGALETKLNYTFVILDPKKELKPGVSLRGRYLWRRTSISLNEKSWLFKILKGVLGRQPTENEMSNFDPESLIGKNVDCLVEQSESKDGSRTFANIISFSKASDKGWDGQPLEAFNYAEAKEKAAQRKAGIEKSSSPAIPVKDDNSVSKDELDELFGETPKKSK